MDFMFESVAGLEHRNDTTTTDSEAEEAKG